jgi:phage replication-related protein YjqB (UPF0714/DUF867 family)
MMAEERTVLRQPNHRNLRAVHADNIQNRTIVQFRVQISRMEQFEEKESSV